jgi:hypothetical protein
LTYHKLLSPGLTPFSGRVLGRVGNTSNVLDVIILEDSLNGDTMEWSAPEATLQIKGLPRLQVPF